MTTTQTHVAVSGLHHLGVPVRSLEDTLAWYKDVLGLQPAFVQQAGEGRDLDAHVQLEEAKMRFAFIELGNTILEFQEYENPLGADHDRRNCDVGAIHICVTVEDIAAAYEVLVEKGVEINAAPTYLPDGNLAGCWFCYFRDLNGIQLELFQTP